MKRYSSVLRGMILGACFGVLAAAAAPGGMESVSIGVYDLRAAGGSGAGGGALVQALGGEGYGVETFSYLDVLSLMRFDIVILADMHQPGMTPSDWRENIKAYLNAGGSVLQIFRHHILGEVSLGVKRIYSRRQIVVKPGHPAVAGLEDFSASFEDHIAERVGPAGTPFLEDDVGEVVAAAGRIGKGKVINIGLGLCMRGGMRSAAEKRLLANSLS